MRQYWSAVLYDRTTHALIRDVLRPSRSSLSEGLQKNADGSVDLYFGPSSRWQRDELDTNEPQRTIWVVFRLYGPEKPLFDKTWTLQDIETVN